MQVWRIDEWGFIAAENLEAAMLWYNKQFGDSGDDREVEEYSLDTEMSVANEPGEADAQCITFRVRIQQMIDTGEMFPAVIAMDAHYA